MKNEERILSMLDLIAPEVIDLKESSVTKGEFKSCKEQTNHRFDLIDGRFTKMETKLQNIDNKVNEQIELLEAQFEVLNSSLFKQESQVKILSRKTTS